MTAAATDFAAWQRARGARGEHFMSLEDVQRELLPEGDCPHPFADMTLELTRRERALLVCLRCFEVSLLARRCQQCRKELFVAAVGPGRRLMRCHCGLEFREIRL